jgi:hypothetical protein
MSLRSLLPFFAVGILFFSCKKEDAPVGNTTAKLIVKLEVDPNQERLGNVGTPVGIPAGNAGQNPVFNAISAHYLELAPSAFTQLGQGEVLYHAPETNTGGSAAIDFKQSKVVAPGDVFFEIPLKEVQAGAYEWVRLSLSYQNYDVQFYFNNLPFTGTVASFVGFNTYIQDFMVKTKNLSVGGNRKQGFWAFETLNNVVSGQAPEGATTVPNPLATTSPIPAGSCVVTGQFDKKLVITGQETEDITVHLSLSVNKSFEWKDLNGNGRWDVDSGNEQIVDMGLRGLKAHFE